jgi:Uncharacterized conserved protein
MDDVVEMYRHINNIAPAPGPERAKPVDIVIFGCPVATFEEVREVARLVKGKKVKPGVMLWVQTTPPTTTWLTTTETPRSSRRPAARSSTRPACA